MYTVRNDFNPQKEDLLKKKSKICKKNARLIFISTMNQLKLFRNYTYLGTLISLTGNFSMALDKLKEKALYALFSRRKHTSLSRLPPFLANKIFDAMVSPILTYNSEVWGACAKSDLKSWDTSQIEKAHLQFCERYVEVSM